MRAPYCLLIFSIASGMGGLRAQSIENGTLAVCRDQQQGRPTASGERHDPNGLTAAHSSLPFGSILRVANFETGKMVDVRVNDRKASDGYIVHLSRFAADRIGLASNAVAPGSLMLIGEMGGVQPVAGTGLPRPFAGKDFGSMFRPISPGADPQPQRFKPSLAPARNMAINNAVEGANQATAGKNRGGLKKIFNRSESVNVRATGTPNVPPSGSPPPPPLGSPGSPSAGHLIPMSANTSTQPPANRVAASQSSSTDVYPYRAQFGAFRGDMNAREMANSLNAAGVGAAVIRSPNTGLFLVVTGGGFRTAEEAQQWINSESVRRGWKDRPVVVR